MNIEIGGGTIPTTGWVNMDPEHGGGVWKRYAQDTPWPCADRSVGALRASHVMEHIPAGQPLLDVMNEAHRVLAPGSTFEIIVPDVLAGTWHAFADPTHVSFWCLERFHYFDGAFAANASYGIKPWSTIELGKTPAIEIRWVGTPR